MANVVTFDTDRLLVIEIPVYATESPTPSPQTMLDNVTSMQEIYSEWKEFVNKSAGSPSTGSLGFPTAIRIVGGDPITDTQDLGITYFMTNGWRFKPAEGNHRWTIDGNVWTDPSGQSVFVPTDGAYTVNVETKVSNLVDSSVARLDLVQLLNAVYIDTVRGVAGTGTIGGTQIGSPTLPSNNIADARIIADSFNIRKYFINGSITLDQAHSEWSFAGISARENATINLAGFSVQDSGFKEVEIAGDAANSEIWATACGLQSVTRLAGELYACGIHETIGLATGLKFVADSCYSEVSGGLPVVLDVNGAADVSFRHYGGGVRVTNLGLASPIPSPIQKMTMGVDHANVILDVSCVGGQFVLRGIGSWVDETGSPSPDVNITGFVEASDVRTSRKILQNRTHTDPNTGIMTVFDDNDVDTFMTADLFEGVTTAQPYRGQGSERRDRLT